jgi:peroxiredoxin
MTVLTRLIGLGLLLALASSADAGKFNKKLSVGDKAPAWENLDGTDGKKHSLSDLKDKDVVVVIFTCNTCPVATDYEDRILAFARDYAKPDSKVAVVAVNVNTVKGDGLPDMKKRAESRKFPFAYLHDPSQEIARAYGAMFTPEFFVLDRDRKVVYMGAMDDKTPPTEPTAKYLEAAVKAALGGKKADTGETSASAGCKIRFNPKKDD